MVIKGLKQENNVVFSLNESTGEWEKINSAFIPQLEALLEKLENMKYPSQNRRENVSFEREFDIGIGIGSVKSYTDEDGDLVYSFQKEGNTSSVFIDEDLEFGISAASPTKDPSTELKELKNFWKVEKNIPKKETEKEPKKEVANKKTESKNTRKVFDMSAISPIKLIKDVSAPLIDPKFCVKSVMVPAKDSGYCYAFEKRHAPISITEHRKYFESYLNDLGRIKKPQRKSSTSLSRPAKISFINPKSHRGNSRFDLGLLLGFMNYNKTENQNSLDTAFCLRDTRASSTDDDKFDNFLSKVVKTEGSTDL